MKLHQVTMATLRSLISPRLRRAFAVYRHHDEATVLFHAKYSDDGIVTRHLPVFRRDPAFLEAYSAGKATGALNGLGFDIDWRAHVACVLAWHALRLEGDFVECGVGRGLLSRTITTYTNFRKSDKTFFLVDTFEGIAEDLLLEQEMNRQEMKQMEAIYRGNFARVAETFADSPNVRLIKGRVPEVLSSIPPRKIAYLSIDMNNAIPEIAAAECLWERVVPFGVVLLDDFAYGTEFVSQTEAFLEFAKRKEVKILTLPTGQGLIIK